MRLYCRLLKPEAPEILGPDDLHHVIALCPTCHRRVHHAEDGAAYNKELKKKLLELEPSEQPAAA
jgi:hypothetical protein